MKGAAIILAAGQGQRFGGDLPKQFQELNDFPVLYHSLKVFNEFDPGIRQIVVLSQKDLSTWNSLCFKYKISEEHEVVFGGNTRSESVQNALTLIDNEELIYIHDSARPCIDITLLKRLKTSAELHGNAIPFIESREALRKMTNESNTTLQRKVIAVIQTPQCIHSVDLKKAYENFFSPDDGDDAELLEKSGKKVHLIKGDERNIKITFPFDMASASVILSNRNK